MVADRVEDAYRRLHPRLWHSLLAYASGNAEIASDAEAEAFSQVMRRSDIDDVDAWIWRSAFRIAAGMLKDKRSFAGLDRQRAEVAIEDPRTVEFLSILGGLSDQQRAVIVLRYIANLKPREIAEVLATSSASIRVQLHRAHAQLREVLEDTQ